jgi:hypothetical protein
MIPKTLSGKQIIACDEILNLKASFGIKILKDK